jgi:hypothetical protein
MQFGNPSSVFSPAAKVPGVKIDGKPPHPELMQARIESAKAELDLARLDLAEVLGEIALLDLGVVKSARPVSTARAKVEALADMVAGLERMLPRAIFAHLVARERAIEAHVRELYAKMPALEAAARELETPKAIAEAMQSTHAAAEQKRTAATFYEAQCAITNDSAEIDRIRRFQDELLAAASLSFDDLVRDGWIPAPSALVSSAAR